MLPLNNTIVTQWIVFSVSLLAGIGSLLAQFLGAGNFTPEAITLFIVAVLMFVLTQITKSDQKQIIAYQKKLEAQVKK